MFNPQRRAMRLWEIFTRRHDGMSWDVPTLRLLHPVLFAILRQHGVIPDRCIKPVNA